MYASVSQRREFSPVYNMGSPDPAAFIPGRAWTEKEWAEVEGQQVWALDLGRDGEKRKERMRRAALDFADEKAARILETLDMFDEATYSHHFLYQICSSCGWHDMSLGKRSQPMKVKPSCPRCHMDDMEEVTECLWVLDL